MSETPVAQDPGLHEYVAGVGARIVRASNSPYPDWQFVVFESDQANAFALPGGRVGVFTGMLQVAADEARARHLEADALGLDYMAQAGYEPTAAIAFWRRMQQVAGDGGQPDFLATHPSSARRIEELLERLPELESGAALSALEAIATRQL